MEDYKEGHKLDLSTWICLDFDNWIHLKLDQPVTNFSMIVTEMKNYCNYFLLMYIVVLVGGYMFSMITSL